MRIALYEPDIPQNTGTILRLCACLGIEAHIIEPAGFPVTDRAFRRAGMDYLDRVALTRHGSFAAFEDWRRAERLKLVLLTTGAETSYLDHVYRARPGAAVRPRKRRRAGSRACGRRRPPAHPDRRRPALAQRGDGRGAGCRRGAAADGGLSAVAALRIIVYHGNILR